MWIDFNYLDATTYPLLGKDILIYLHIPINQFNKKEIKYISQSRLIEKELGYETDGLEKYEFESLFFTFDKWRIVKWKYLDVDEFVKGE
jgi:hypothetical protein